MSTITSEISAIHYKCLLVPPYLPSTRNVYWQHIYHPPKMSTSSIFTRILVDASVLQWGLIKTRNFVYLSISPLILCKPY